MPTPKLDAARKIKIRSELLRCATGGAQPLTYGDFYNRVTGEKMLGQFPWTAYFDRIAMEERSHGYPDITFLVYETKSQRPGQIDFRPVKNGQPDKKQAASLQKGMREIRRLYSPGTTKIGPY